MTFSHHHSRLYRLAALAFCVAVGTVRAEEASPFVPFVRASFLAANTDEEPYRNGHANLSADIDDDAGALGGFGATAVNFNLPTPGSLTGYREYLSKDLDAHAEIQPNPILYVGNYGSSSDESTVIGYGAIRGTTRVEVDDAIGALGVLDLEQSQPSGPMPTSAIFDQQVSIILDDLNEVLTAINELDNNDQTAFLGQGGSYTEAQKALSDLVLEASDAQSANDGVIPTNALDAEIAALNTSLTLLNLDLAGIVLDADAPDQEDTRLADDIDQNGSGGAIRDLADIDGDGVTNPDEVIAVINDFGDLHEFNVFFDLVVSQERFTANSIELMKQSVLGSGPASASEGWRVDGFVDDWSFGVGDEVRGLSLLSPSVVSHVGAEGVRRWMQGLRVSTFGVAGVRAMHLEDRFSFLGLGSILGRTSVNQENDHYVLGPQLGLGWVAEGPTLRFEAALLGLVGYGRVERRQAGVYGADADPGALNRSVVPQSSTISRHADGDDRVAWHGESRLTASCQLTQRLRFDATWRWMVTGPISSAYESVGWNAPDFGLSRTNDDARTRSDWFFGLTYTR